MGNSISELALARVLTYLNGMDVSMTAETNIAALQLVQEAIALNHTDIYGYIMDHIPERFTLPDLQLPPLTPPIRRGCIGYGKPR